MKIEELVEQLHSEAAGYLLLAVDQDGQTFGKASEVPLTLSLFAAQNQPNMAPKDLLGLITALESLSLGEKKRGRPRRSNKAVKQASSEKQPKSVPANAS
jgi:hypothetical protein